MSLLVDNSRIYCYLGQRDALNWVIRSHTTQLYSFSGPGQEIILLELLVSLSLLGRSTNSEYTSPLHSAWNQQFKRLKPLYYDLGLVLSARKILIPSLLHEMIMTYILWIR